MENWIAETNLYCVDEKNGEFDLPVKISVPKQVEENRYATQIDMGIVIQGIDPIVGVDSFQSLCLAVSFVKTVLEKYRENGGKVFWGRQSEDEIIDIEKYDEINFSSVWGKIFG